jgi:hypothetical protein
VRDFKACRLPGVEPSCLAGCRASGELTLAPGERFHAVKRPGFHSQLWDARLLCYPEAIAALGDTVDAFVVDLRDPGFLRRPPAAALVIARCFREAVAAGRMADPAQAQVRRLAGTWFRGPLGRREAVASPRAPRPARGGR